eukprot:INCI5759.1.p1 GENE.INCI5759.1~~INCI5759.1.p1  ORF type:complete len:360 (+),score=56.54 INCI5759.1:129-1208(+)
MKRKNAGVVKAQTQKDASKGHGRKPKDHVPPWENERQLSVPLVAALVLLAISFLLLKVGCEDYYFAENVTGPYRPEMVNIMVNTEIPLYVIEIKTIAWMATGMGAMRLGLNHWMKDEDASSIVAILFSLYLAPVGIMVLSAYYSAGLPAEICIGSLRSTLLSDQPNAVSEWGSFMSYLLGGGNIFNGYITYELVWELAVYGLSNPTNLYHHTVFLLLSGLFCLKTCYSYIGASFMIMEISTIPLKIRRLTFRVDYSGPNGSYLKRIYDWATLLFALTFVVTRIAHMAFSTYLYFGWVIDGSMEGHSMGATTDKAIAILMLGAFLLQCFWFMLILRKCSPRKKQKTKTDGAESAAGSETQ